MDENEMKGLLQRLEKHYGEPVMPLHRFCDAITLWMNCIEKNNTDPELSKAGYQGGRYYKFLSQIEMDIRKSNLLGRLLYGKERFRTEMCPIHKGHWHGDAMFFNRCPHNCDGTGWLRARPEDGGYTGGLKISLLREVRGEQQIKDPKTHKWRKLRSDDEPE
ncbi:MAG: hypothetical protein ABSA70_05800 [Terriglobia bacterium]